MSEPFNVLTEARHGLVLYNRHDVYIGRSLELYGEWSAGETDLLCQVLQPGMVVVDAGANIGTHTLAFARAVAPGGVVYAFEPQRIVYQTLVANVALNSLTNVVCQQRALGAEPGRLLVPPIDYTATSNFGGVELGAWQTGEPVEVVRIDDLELAACHLIKVDVEGMERAVLEGASATIARCQPLLYVEADRAAHRDDLLRWLADRGYVMYWHQVPLYSPTNAKGNPTNVFEGIVSLNVLAVPSTVPQTIDGLERVEVPSLSAVPRGPALSTLPWGPALTPGPPLPQAGEGEPTGHRRRVRAGRAIRDRAARRQAILDERASLTPALSPRERAQSAPPLPLAGPGPRDEVVDVLPRLQQALAVHQDGRLAEAATLYEAVLAIEPDQPDGLHLLGMVRREERRFDEALGLLERAVRVAPDQALFHFNLGAVRRQAGRLPEAEDALRQALTLSPSSPEARLELGLTLLDRRALADAEDVLRVAVALAPDHAPTHFGLAMLLLLTGRYQEGWTEYAWRWQLPEMLRFGWPVGVPRWDGSPLDGRTILLESEQGHGDTIQLARYAPLLAERGGRVMLRCRPEIKPLLATLDGVTRIVTYDEPLPSIDVVATLLDLPGLLGTTVDTIPARVPYLHADPERVQEWAARLDAGRSAPDRRELRVGLVWAGSPDHRANGVRSTSLAQLAALGRVPGVRFFSLQKGAPGAEALTPPPGLDLTDLGPALADFADTAAVVSLLDLVITVDTSVGHLAGALGKPTWILPWATHDWRWLLHRADTPWYPTARLFRQDRPGVWGPTIERVAGALTNLAAARGLRARR